MSRLAVSWGLLAIAASLPTAGQLPAERPGWAEGMVGWGVMEIRADQPGRKDLERLEWRRGMLVAQDERDTIYVLDPEEGTVTTYAPNGTQRNARTIPGWQSELAAPGVSGFAVADRGKLFAFAARGRVTVFDQEKVRATFALPTFVADLAMADGDLVIARLPVEFVARTGGKGPFQRKEVLLTRCALDGTVKDEFLAPDEGEGPDPFGLAMTQSLVVAADAANGTLWAADRHRLYRLRRLTSSGTVKGEWKDERLTAEVRWEGERPEAVTRMFRKEAAARYQPVKAPSVARDLVVRNGLVYVLLGAHLIDAMQFLDVFAGAGEPPFWRIGLHPDRAVTYTQLAITNDEAWLFPAAPGEHPVRIQRLPDELMLEARARPTPPRDGEDPGQR